MIKAIIFDLFGTLTNGACDPEMEIIKTFNLSQDYKFVEKFVCGTKFHNIDSYLQTIIKGLNLTDTQNTKQKLIEIFNKDSKREEIRKDLVEFLKDLKSKNYKLCILSNIPNPVYDILQKNNLRELFDVILYSYELGIIKPDLRIFKLMLSRLGLKPEECLFIDNKEENNLEAESIGIKTILFKNSDQLKNNIKQNFGGR